MIFEGEFFSGGHLRWNLGWPSPNYAGAFLVSMLALLWIFSGSRWRWAALACEAGGLFLLAKTYSRGAVVAWGLAWLFGVAVSRGWRAPAERLVWAARVVVLAVMLLATGFGWSRMTVGGESATIRSPSASAVAKLWRDKSDGPTTAGIKRNGEVSATEDGSVVNRLALWRGGVKMIATSPWTGWGAGESGRAYMNWYQEVDRDEGYTTMVNSYLHVAVEHGVPVLAMVLWVGAWLLLVAGIGARDESVSLASSLLHVAAGASLVAWAVANVFTTLWIEPKLWIVPTMVCLVLGWQAWRMGGIRLARLTFASLAIAVLAVGSLYGAGKWLSRNESLHITPRPDGTVIAASVNSGSMGKLWQIWPDPAVVGPSPGKELRRWLLTQPPGTRLISHRTAPLRAEESRIQAVGVMLFGRQAERIYHGFAPDCRELWLVHPLGSPPPARASTGEGPVVTVLLPAIDEAGNGPAWRRWATATGAQVINSPESGLDIRSAWPAIIQR